MPEGGSAQSGPAETGWSGERLAALAQAAWLAGVLTVWWAFMFRSPLDPDYTAGELLDHLMAWQETGLLYPPLGSGEGLRVLNYPPLSLWLTRVGTVLGLEPITAGRLMSSVAGVLVLCVLWAWSGARGACRTARVGTVGLMGASLPFVYATGQVHVEVWAVLFTLAGFALFDRGRGRLALAAGGALLAVACFAKQTQVVPALIGIGWLIRYRRDGRVPALLAFGAAGLSGVVALDVLVGGDVWSHLLTYTVGTYSLSTLAEQMGSHAAPWVVLLGVAAWSGLRRGGPGAVGAVAPSGGAGGRSDAAVWYWVGAFLWSFSSVRDGSGYAYFLELHLATALLVGPVLFPGSRRPLRTAAAGAGRFRAVLPVQLLAANLLVAVVLASNVSRVTERSATLDDVCAGFPEGAPALVEDAGLARACGRTAALHPFIMTSLSRRGLWDSRAFEERIRSGTFRSAVLGFDPRTAPAGAQVDRWTDGMVAAFGTASEVEALPGGWWWVAW